jgi:hypothetical protein
MATVEEVSNMQEIITPLIPGNQPAPAVETSAAA